MQKISWPRIRKPFLVSRQCVCRSPGCGRLTWLTLLMEMVSGISFLLLLRYWRNVLQKILLQSVLESKVAPAAINKPSVPSTSSVEKEGSGMVCHWEGGEERWSYAMKKLYQFLGLPWSFNGKGSVCQCRWQGSNPWVVKILWRRKWQPASVFLSWKSHGSRSLAGYSPWSHKKSVTWLSDSTQQ